jgi:hypothetical protein
MSNERDRRRLVVAAAAALGLVFAASWILLDLTEGRPGWLVVEGPPAAVLGGRIDYRVTLKEIGAGGLVDCTLHHANAERRGWGFLASAGPPQPAVAGRTYVFEFTVPEHADTAYVFAIVFLGPSGRWEDGTRAVSTRYIPLSRTASPAPPAALKRTAVYRYPTAAEAARLKARPPRPAGRPSVWVHPVVGALLLAAAFGALLSSRRSGPTGPGGGPGERTVWLVMAVVLAAAAAVEISGLAGHLAAWGRHLAEERGVYELRKPFQEAITAATAAASLGLFLLFVRAVRKPGSPRLLWWAGLGLAAYLAVSFVGVLSFHAVDVVRGRVWHGVSAVDAARGAGAIAACFAALAAARRRPSGPVT